MAKKSKLSKLKHLKWSGNSSLKIHIIKGLFIIKKTTHCVEIGLVKLYDLHEIYRYDLSILWVRLESIPKNKKYVWLCASRRYDIL